MKRIINFSLIVLGFLAFLYPTSVSAAAPFQRFPSTCSGKAQSSSVCQEVGKNNNPFDGSSGIVATIANFMAAIGGIIAVVVIMLSGLRLIMSGGDSAKLTQSRNAIIYAAAGIVVIVLARTIIGFVLSKL